MNQLTTPNVFVLNDVIEKEGEKTLFVYNTGKPVMFDINTPAQLLVKATAGYIKQHIIQPVQPR